MKKVLFFLVAVFLMLSAVFFESNTEKYRKVRAESVLDEDNQILEETGEILKENTNDEILEADIEYPENTTGEITETDIEYPENMTGEITESDIEYPENAEPTETNIIDESEILQPTEIILENNQNEVDSGFTLRKEFTIQSSADDAEVSASSVNLTSSGLELHGKVSSTESTVYLRFTNVNIPSDAKISRAYLSFTSRDSSTAGTVLNIQGELGNGNPLTRNTADYSARVFTEDFVQSTSSAIRSNEIYQTSDIYPIFGQMLANNSDSYVFKIKGNMNGSLVARSFDSDKLRAPKLIVEYSSNTGEFSLPIAISGDDGEERATGSVSLSGSLHLGGYSSSSNSESSRVIMGLRFNNVTIPENAEITNAYIEFTPRTRISTQIESYMDIKCENGNAAAYTTASKNITNRNYGKISVNYRQPTISTTQRFSTPNLRTVIDECRLSGWQSGQALGFKISGDKYIGSVYDGSNLESAPRLVIQFKSGKGAYIEDEISNPSLLKNIYINEISTEGTASSKDDWIELYNDNNYILVLNESVYFTNDTKKPEKFELKGISIPAKGYKTIYCDEKTELGSDHASFSLKASGEVFINTKVDGAIQTINSLKYDKQLYNETFGRKPDAGNNLVPFANETFEKSNNNAPELYPINVSTERGVYDSGFELSISSKPNVNIRYTLDGTFPTNTKGTVYAAPIRIDKTSVIKIYAYDNYGNSNVIAHTYVLRNNYNNESGWSYKTNINGQFYAETIDDFPIVSITSDRSSLSSSTYAQSTFEYLDSHINPGASNLFTNSGAKKFGQATAGWTNSNVTAKFHRDYDTKKLSYDFFDEIIGEAFPLVSKFGKIDLKEGEDGPQSDIWDLGYNRYSEKAVNTLAIQMDKFALHTRYVYYIYNGKFMGLKTLRESFSNSMFEEYFGDDSDNYTKVTMQDGGFSSGGIEDADDGDPALWKRIYDLANSKNFQEFKKYVDVEDLIKMQILFMFIDSEREVEAVLHNDAATGGGVKMISNINDLDGAFFNDKKTGTEKAHFIGGGGNYRYKWGDSTSMMGAGKLFGNFSGNSTNLTAGNLEFKTLVKDQVLKQIGPVSGDFRGADGAPLSVDNVKKVIMENQAELDKPYQLDAAFMGFSRNAYQDWLNWQKNILIQVEDRVKFSLEKWKEYNMAHTLEAVGVNKSNEGITLTNPNSTDVYYTLDGTDPMGADGVISKSAVKYTNGTVIAQGGKIIIRPFTTNNWGPLTIAE